MPRPSEANATSEHVLRLLKDSFHLTENGLILDNDEQGWFVWNVTDFHRWWLSIETNTGLPLGRKLLNAAADHEEFLLSKGSTLDVGWFRSRRKQQAAIHKRWLLHGWGSFDIATSLITSSVFAPLCSGFSLATRELLDAKRLRVQWRQFSNSQIQLELEDAQRAFIPAPDPPEFIWNTAKPKVKIQNELELDLEVVSNGWAHAGERCCMIPVGVFTRFFESLSSQGIQLRPQWLDCWEFGAEFTDTVRAPLILTALAVDEMVSRGEQPIYIQGVESWKTLCAAYLKPFGFGLPLRIQESDRSGGVVFTLESCSQFPMLVGYLFSFWQRAHGRKAKISIQSEGTNWSVTITSLLSYVE
ncbi:MAG: hypothetical protein L7U62_06080 [Candidatus Poseidoniaceae archaeon]|nr:hypothetical protein [Candidatus Poseidoniaceae archaeon]